MQRLITADAETFYDTKAKYSLNHMGAEAYIRDPRFQFIGWGVREWDARRKKLVRREWLAGHDPQALQEFIESFDMEREGTAVLTHNGSGFDFLLLGWEHGIHPQLMLDTLQISRYRYGRKGPGGSGNSLKQLARHYNVGTKGEEVIHADGLRLETFPAKQLRQYGQYCLNDCDLTEAVFRASAHEVEPWQLFDMSMLTRMSSRPQLVVDVPLVREALVRERARKGERTKELADTIGVTIEQLRSAMMSNPKFAEVIRSLGYEPPMKVSKTTKKPTFAFAKTDPEMQEWVESDDELLADVVGLRLGLKSTQMETRLEHFVAIGSRGPMPAAMRYSGAATGRAAADGGIHKGQLHNLPSRGKEGKQNALRQSLRAPKGMKLYGADSGQIEVRTEAWLADESLLLDVFNKQQPFWTKAWAAETAEERKRWADKAEAFDPYLGLGVPLFGRPITKADKTERNINKAAVLAAQFKQGPQGFYNHCRRNGIQIDMEMAEKTIWAYRDTHTQIANFWRRCKRAVESLAGERGPVGFGYDYCLEASQGELRLPSGRKLYYAECSSDINPDSGFKEYTYFERLKGFRKYVYDGLLCENIVQATAYDILMWQAQEIKEETGLEPVLFTHDELVYVGPDGEDDYFRDLLARHMTTAPPWMPGIPLAIDYGSGYRYSDV